MPIPAGVSVDTTLESVQLGVRCVLSSAPLGRDQPPYRQGLRGRLVVNGDSDVDNGNNHRQSQHCVANYPTHCSNGRRTRVTLPNTTRARSRTGVPFTHFKSCCSVRFFPCDYVLSVLYNLSGLLHLDIGY